MWDYIGQRIWENREISYWTKFPIRDERKT